jgi:hypothetical protein
MSQGFGGGNVPSGTPGGVDAAGKVAGPAVALIITGVINLLLSIATVGYGFVLGNIDIQAQLPPDAIQGDPAQVQQALAVAGPMYIGLGIVDFLASILILFGGIKMKGLQSWGLCMAAAIVAMIPGLSPCCILGLPLGIWAVVVLVNADVKAAFR